MADGSAYLKAGRVCFLIYSVWVPDATMTLVTSGHVTEVSPEVGVLGDIENNRYGIRGGVIRHYIHGLQADLTTSAGPTEREHAFDFNLSCLTSWRGCVRPCQLMPSVWRDLVARHMKEQQEVRNEEYLDSVYHPVCRALSTTHRWENEEKSAR
jgi:hypothetical protein